MAQTVYLVVCINQDEAFLLKVKHKRCVILINLTWLYTTNSVLCVLLESINLILLKLTGGHRRLWEAQKTT